MDCRCPVCGNQELVELTGDKYFWPSFDVPTNAAKLESGCIIKIRGCTKCGTLLPYCEQLIEIK